LSACASGTACTSSHRQRQRPQAQAQVQEVDATAEYAKKNFEVTERTTEFSNRR
jgi:hypothetical protein